MRSDYALMIDKKDLAALSLTKQASAYSKQALAIDPHMYDAYLASGVENYMLSLKPAAVRWILGITGASTDKEQGIKLLTLAANQGHYLAPFARMMLAVAAIRDGNPAAGTFNPHHALKAISRTTLCMNANSPAFTNPLPQPRHPE